jgi:hypothetical protein
MRVCKILEQSVYAEKWNEFLLIHFRCSSSFFISEEHLMGQFCPSVCHMLRTVNTWSRIRSAPCGLSSYASCVECSALCWKQCPLKKSIATKVPKNGQICYKKSDSEEYENNIKSKKHSTSVTKPSEVCRRVSSYYKI